MSFVRRSENIWLHSSRNLLDTPNRILPDGPWTGGQGGIPLGLGENAGAMGLLVVRGWVGFQISPQLSSGMISIVVGVGRSGAEAWTTTRAERSIP
jgi:hypothetical protein